MAKDKRRYTRFNPQGLLANIILEPPPPKKEIIVEGTVINMSYTGIKIKLKTPINIDVAEIKINLTLPASGVPISIHGVIKYLNDQSECGLQYSEQTEDNIDHLMFECIKVADHKKNKKGYPISKEVTL